LSGIGNKKSPIGAQEKENALERSIKTKRK